MVETGPDGAPAYSIQWGFGIGFPLNDGLAYDADYHCVDGMTFTISGVRPAEIRVNLTTTTTEDQPYFVTMPVSSQATYSLAFRTFAQGPWVTNPQPLDMRRLSNIQFFVFTNTQSETPFDFCISKIGLVYHTIGAE